MANDAQMANKCGQLCIFRVASNYEKKSDQIFVDNLPINFAMHKIRQNLINVTTSCGMQFMRQSINSNDKFLNIWQHLLQIIKYGVFFRWKQKVNLTLIEVNSDFQGLVTLTTWSSQNLEDA